MMRRYGRWLVLGVALAALALGVVLALWLPREAPTPSGAADSAVLQDTVQVEVTRSAPKASPELVEGASPVERSEDSARPPGETPFRSGELAEGTGPATLATPPTLATLATPTAPAPPPGGEQTTISDSVEFIVRDASGKVKQVVRGP